MSFRNEITFWWTKDPAKRPSITDRSVSIFANHPSSSTTPLQTNLISTSSNIKQIYESSWLMVDVDWNPFGHPSVPRVLSISEILRYIFKEVDNVDRASAARVCRTWVDVALDVLWEHLESPFPIMALLGPTSFQGDGWDWESGFPDGDWTRFQSYTKRVRSFSYDGQLYNDGGFAYDHLTPDVPAKLLYYVATNQGGYLLPHVLKIRWRASTDNNLQLVIPFLSPTLKGIDVEAQWEVSSSATRRLLRSLHSVLPQDLVSFRYVPNEEGLDGLEEGIERVIVGRKDLQTLRIPTCPMTATMFIPQLRNLEAEFNSTWNSGPGAFLMHLSEKCPLIEDLRIIFLSDSTLTIQSIYPLLRCSKLRSLDLEYAGGVDLEEKHIKEMGSAWRDLEALHISARRLPNGPVVHSVGTPIASLLVFIQSFSPKLRKLAIYLSLADIPPPPDPPVRFPSLEFFSVGTSQLGYSAEELMKVLWFLGTILPTRIEFVNSDVPGYDWYRSIFQPHEDGRLTTHPTWDALSGMLLRDRKVDSNEA